MTACSRQIEEAALDLAWSLWAELGVSGWQRRHTSHAIDPEPLILFTASLGSADPRLRDESTDWCVTYGRYVSTARLKNLLAGASPAVQENFGQTAATVNAHSRSRWPAATKERPFEPTGRSAVVDFRRPSLIALRLRALFGVGARAEIVRAFVADPHAVLTAADLAGDAGYTKRNVAEGLEALRMAGLMGVERVRNQLAYHLQDAEWPTSLPGGMPSLFPRWRSIFRILDRMLEAMRRAETLGPRVRMVEAADVLHELEADLRLVGELPLSNDQGLDLWAELERRALRLSKGWASGALGDRDGA